MRLSSAGALMPTRGFSRRKHDLLDAWVTHDGILATSQIGDMFLPGTHDTEVGPTWLIAVSRDGQRPSDADLQRVIEAFELPAFDEDNHFPGITRSLFCPIDEQYRSACECKLTEQVIVEDDGYTWTTPTDGPCRGCYLEGLARLSPSMREMPCPIHAGATP